MRLHAYLGHEVIRPNHIGDWGTPFGMLMEHLLDVGEDVAEALGVGDLTDFYQSARRKFAPRSGASVKLTDLLDEAVTRARMVVEDKNPTLPAEVVDRLGEEIGIGAVKYADLSAERVALLVGAVPAKRGSVIAPGSLVQAGSRPTLERSIHV